MEETKKIIITSDKKNKTKTGSKIKKDLAFNELIKEPERIKNYIESLEKNEINSWFNPNKNIENEQVNKAIENIKSCLKKSKKSIPQKINVQCGSSKTENNTKDTNDISKKIQMRKKVLKKTQRKYKPHEIKQIVKSCKEYYSKKKYNEFHKILKKLTKNQCEQVLLQECNLRNKIKNTPLPVLKFILYMHLSCSYINFKLE